MRLSILLLFSIIAVISLHNHYYLAEAKPVEQATTPEPSSTPTPTPTPTPASFSPAPANHRINFLGLKHDYENDEKAKQALANNLKEITGHDDIIVESIDEQGASWHIGGKLGSTEQDCPEDEIRQVVAKIKEPNETGFTREFKMWIDERFLRPHQVQIVWRGPCGNIARKRSRVETGPMSKQNVILKLANSSVEELMPTSTTEATGILSVTSLSSDSKSDANLTSATTTTIAEPKQPSTTTELPVTQPAVEKTTTTATTSEESLFSDSKSFESMDFPPLNITVPEISFDSITNTSVTTNTTATTTKIPPENPTTPQESNSTLSRIPPPTTPAPPTSTLEPSPPSPPTTTKTPATVASSPSSEEEAVGLGIESESSGPHYGKYIGFGAAFLIFVAYLVCSRAYKRHGMYELHSE